MFDIGDLVYFTYQNSNGKSVVVLRKIYGYNISIVKIYYLCSPKTNRLTKHFKAFEHELTAVEKD